MDIPLYEKGEFKPWAASNAITNIDAPSPGAALHRGLFGYRTGATKGKQGYPSCVMDVATSPCLNSH